MQPIHNSGTKRIHLLRVVFKMSPRSRIDANKKQITYQ